MDLLQITLITVVIILSAAFLFLKRRPDSPPGPFALPIAGHLHLLGPRIHHTFNNLSLRYGPIFQFYIGSIPCVVVSTPELAQEFLKTHDLAFSSRMQSTAIDIITYNSSFAFAPYGPYWKYIKKLCTYEILGARNLSRFEPIRNQEVRSFVQELVKKGESGTEMINVTEELVRLTSNMISHMMLSIRCSETKGEAEAVRTVVREVTQIFGEFDVSDILWFYKSFDLQGISKRSKDIHRRYDVLLEKIISDREKLRGGPGGGGAREARDFLDMLLDEMENEKSEVKFTRDHLKSLILDFFTAGTDTTSIAMEWTIAELINNPTTLRKAQEEMDKVVGSKRLVRESDASNLPYLQAIIKESFRLHPPIPLIVRKSASDCVINGYKVPTNTLLFVNVWSICRNSNYWECPLTFRPERFLDKENNSMDIKGQHFELLPFGTGRRGCPGMLLAIQGMVTTIGTMVQCFDWKLPDDSKGVDMTEKPGLSVPRANNLFCHAVPRINIPSVF